MSVPPSTHVHLSTHVRPSVHPSVFYGIKKKRIYQMGFSWRFLPSLTCKIGIASIGWFNFVSFSRRHLITSVGLTVMDTFNGPFQLEIDYMGVMHDKAHNPTFEYENYKREFNEEWLACCEVSVQTSRWVLSLLSNYFIYTDIFWAAPLTFPFNCHGSLCCLSSSSSTGLDEFSPRR